MMVTDPTRPDSLALTAYQRLSQGNNDGAIESIDDALARLGEERPGLRARLWGWRCQAHLNQRDAQQAITAVREGLRAARDAGDVNGLKALRDLQSQAMAMAAALKVTAPTDDAPLSQAIRALEAGKEQLGEILALGALAHARKEGTPRDVVFAYLTLARVPRRTEAAILDAHRYADTTSDKNLVTAVARAASAAGVTIAPKVF